MLSIAVNRYWSSCEILKHVVLKPKFHSWYIASTMLVADNLQEFTEKSRWEIVISEKEKPKAVSIGHHFIISLSSCNALSFLNHTIASVRFWNVLPISKELAEWKFCITNPRKFLLHNSFRHSSGSWSIVWFMHHKNGMLSGMQGTMFCCSESWLFSLWEII